MREGVDHVRRRLGRKRECGRDGVAVGKIELKEQLVIEVKVAGDGVEAGRFPGADDAVAAKCPNGAGCIIQTAEIRNALALEHAVDADGALTLFPASVLIQEAQRATLGESAPYGINHRRAQGTRLRNVRLAGQICDLGPNIGERGGKSGRSGGEHLVYGVHKDVCVLGGNQAAGGKRVVTVDGPGTFFGFLGAGRANLLNHDTALE